MAGRVGGLPWRNKCAFPLALLVHLRPQGQLGRGEAATPYQSKFRTFSGSFNEARSNRPEKLEFFADHSL
jgi:hypothetical protein